MTYGLITQYSYDVYGQHLIEGPVAGRWLKQFLILKIMTNDQMTAVESE